MEVWDCYDNQRQKVAQKAIRGEGLPEGTFDLVVHIGIFNHSKQMLIQKRAAHKKGFPGLWDVSLGGHAIEGETSQMAAQRELKEELGLSMDFEDIRPYFTINYLNGFDDIYLVEQEIDLAQCSLQEEEVEQVAWATREKIKEMIREGTFIPYKPALIDLYFDSLHDRGSTLQEVWHER